MRHAAAVAVLLFGACKSDAPTPAPVVAAAPVEAPAAPKRLVVTPALLESYLQYQNAVLARGDGGPLERAKNEDAARKQVGLSDTEFRELDSLVGAVVARRMVSHLTATPAFAPDLERMGQNLAPEQKKRLEQALEAFKASAQSAKELKAEREKYGSENVDAVLGREADLSKSWQALLNAYGTSAP